MRSIWTLAVLAIVVGLASGCSQKEPAEQAIAAAEQALVDVNEQAQKYIPDQYAELKDELDKARKALGEEKYAEAIEAAKDLPARAKELGEAAAAAREALAAQLKPEWEQLTGALPGKVAALESRVAELDAGARLPKGVERKDVDGAKAMLEVVRKAWTDAQAAFEQGDVERAVARVRGSNHLVDKLMESIGMTPPAAEAPVS